MNENSYFVQVLSKQIDLEPVMKTINLLYCNLGKYGVLSLERMSLEIVAVLFAISSNLFCC